VIVPGPRRSALPHIIDDDERWHLLRPFLAGKRCKECKTWSTFHADIASDGKEGKLIIKSLEHGRGGRYCPGHADASQTDGAARR
jgi:hypothetical protein